VNASGELLTSEELARCLRVRPATIRLWAREGLIPAVRIGGKVLRFDLADVLVALKATASKAVPA
jgi:excisionase family DNA binding protein